MPPKKQTTNTKVLAAKEKQDVVESKRRAAKDAEDERKRATEWSEGANLRGAARSAEAEMKSAEAARKAAEKARLLKEEEDSLASIKKPAKKSKAPALKPWEAALSDGAKKKTRHELEMEKEALQKAKDEEALKAGKVVVVETELEENVNRRAEEKWASGLDGALEELSIGEAKPDRYPEKRMKAAYRAYEEANLPVLRMEKPGLKLSQYKQMIFKAWQSSPENPLNQVP